MNGATEVKAQGTAETEQNGTGHEQAYDDQGGEDEIDFNLGSGGGGSGQDYGAPPEKDHTHGPGIKEDG